MRRIYLPLLVMALVSLISGALPQPAYADPGWLSGWDKRVKLTIDQNDIDAALSDFPILVYLSTSSGRNSDDVSFVFDELASDDNRKKIAVTKSDETTELTIMSGLSSSHLGHLERGERFSIYQGDRTW